jgi:hypothetical protein
MAVIERSVQVNARFAGDGVKTAYPAKILQEEE